MSILANPSAASKAEQIVVDEESLRVELADGRTVTVPLVWFPRLLHGSVAERSNFRLIGDGEGIHWPVLDEDISVDGLLAGRPSGESPTSFQKWLRARSK